MSYTNATFYLSPEDGSDTARTALFGVTVANNGSGLVRCTKSAHGLVTGAVVDVTGNYIGAWKITVISSSTFDLVGSTYNTSAGVTVTPRGGSSMADAWKTISSGATAARHAAGDTIRIKASPDLTSLAVNGTWTDGPLQATKAIVSSTNATPIVITLSSGNYTTMAPAVGDTVIVNGHTTNTNANGVWAISAVNGSTTITLQDAAGNNSVGNGVGGASGTVRKATNMVVKLASAVTKNVCLCGNQGTKTNWTASANVTCTVTQADFKEGGECQSIAVAAAFTTGLAAYLPITLTDFSSYQQVSFWIKQTAGTLGAAGAVSVTFCTDTIGAVVMNTSNVPAIGALNQWQPVVVNAGGSLNSAVQSIGFVVNTDNGAQTFLIDNVIACQVPSADASLNLTSLISKNTGTEAWFGIQSINGTRVMLDSLVNTIPSSAPQRGYSGTTETVTTWKRETSKTAMAAISTTRVQSFQLTGTQTPFSPITYSGGWNRTDMTTQTGQTWFDGQNGFGIGLDDLGATKVAMAVDRMHFVRYSTGFTLSASSSTYCVIGSMSASNCTSAPISIIPPFATATTLTAVQNGSTITIGPAMTVTTVARADGSAGSGVTTGSASITTTITQANNNAVTGILGGYGSAIGTVSAANGNASSGYQPAGNSFCGSIVANSNTSYAIVVPGSLYGVKILGGSSTGNGIAGVGLTGASGGSIVLRGFTANEATPFVVSGTAVGQYIYSEKNGGVVDAHLITTDGGTIASATDQRHTASGVSWKFSPTSSNRGGLYPLTLSVAKIACAANTAVNLKIWVYVDDGAIQGKLRVPGGQLAGVPSDVTVNCAPSPSTWTQSSILTFTPTEAGVVEVFFDAFDPTAGGSTHLWIDDISISP